MKKQLEARKFLITSALLLSAVTGLFANDGPDVEKKKTFTKNYAVSSSDKISLSNQFGELKILTWNKSEVQVDVTITVKGSSEERAQAILDDINIEDRKTSEGVFFKTNMNSNHDNKRGKHGDGNQSMEINYEVHLPAANPLDVDNQFGRTIIPDISGPSDITQKFGDLVAGNLSSLKELHVEFGSAVVENIANGKVVIKFSKAEIKKMSGAIKATLEYVDKIKLNLTNNVTDLSINNQFSKIELTVADGFNGDFDIHTSFGEVHNGGSVNLKETKDDDEDHGPKFDKDYTGKSGSGGCKVKIKSSFGNVKFI